MQLAPRNFLSSSIRRRVAVVALLLVSACAGAEEAENQVDMRPAVEVATVQPLAAPGAVRASGLIGYKREPELAFTSPGVIGAINVDVGDEVRRGQNLATLRRTSVGANAAEAALARENAERDLARTRELFEQGFVSEARLESAQLAVERAREFTSLSAPASGVILRRLAEPAQTVAAGSPVLVLGDTASGLIVRAPIASGQAARVRVGDSVRVRVSELNNEARNGRVTRISAKGDELTGAFEVEVDIGEPENLRSGMVAEVEIAAAALASHDEVLLAPALALLDARADQGVMFVLDDDDVAHRRAVRTAGVTLEGVTILEGLAPGDRVVAAGAAYVRDGEPVRISDAAS